MIDARLFLKLQEVFADSFNHTKEVERIDRIAGPWGIEEYRTCIYDTVTLAEQILLTANAISHGGGTIWSGHLITWTRSKRKDCRKTQLTVFTKTGETPVFLLPKKIFNFFVFLVLTFI